jgi:hypothetical protein
MLADGWTGLLGVRGDSVELFFSGDENESLAHERA